ncbi:hypothetical protein [Bradyrhizobium sp. CCGUVB14]|uniref:hypothetical protein n=1 Tax=Bradyrhizobium sp. CCGUVB14 TaxID=2949628 RepID=UPI0020B3B137|nr:hypothetical protein [Bradyrhizobium sp. CCGUVB14]MCP3446159.1 hypothetical protein [Bradyrhizobium sp. CCGUVB14]
MNLPESSLRLGKAIGILLCAAILASHLVSISRWSEDRGVNDDICYLRQAHLFQRFGLGGLDTNFARDDDGYFLAKMKNLSTWVDGQAPVCHTPMSATGKLVLQYPPGTGLMLALFPSGHQVVALYSVCTLIIFLFACAAIWLSRSRAQLALATAFGLVAIYMMINPVKASYSIAPTMVLCATAGLLTARLFAEERQRQRMVLVPIIGLLIGIAVNMRVPNLLLSAGYCAYLLVAFLATRKATKFSDGVLFAVAFVIGMSPTLVANAINAGSPFSTTYSAADVVAPSLDGETIRAYLGDPQSLLVVLSLLWTLGSWHQGKNRLALLLGSGLAINLTFFITHPIFTQYYTIPICALTLWTLLFAFLIPPSHQARSR